MIDLAGAACWPKVSLQYHTWAEQPRADLDIIDHALEVETNGLLVIVRILLDFKTRVLEDRNMVAPRRCRQVNGLGVRVETLKESSADSKSAGTTDRLGDGNATFFERCAVFAVC